MRKLRLREVKCLFRFPQLGNGRESTEPGLTFSRAVVLIQGWFCPCGTFWKVWRHLWLSHLEGGYYWRLECRGQGCYKHPTGPYSGELPGRKWQYSCSWETLRYSPVLIIALSPSLSISCAGTCFWNILYKIFPISVEMLCLHSPLLCLFLRTSGETI